MRTILQIRFWMIRIIAIGVMLTWSKTAKAFFPPAAFQPRATPAFQTGDEDEPDFGVDIDEEEDEDEDLDVDPPGDFNQVPGPPSILTAWSAVGPAPIVNGNTPGGTPTSGRMGQAAGHPTDANTIYIASVGGGIWKTTDGGTTWTPLTDNQATLWGYAVAISASDPNTIYAGTGEPTNSGSSFYGRGVLKSTDAGATWTLMGSSTFDRISISRVVIHPTDPNIVWVATGGGVNALGTNRGVWKTINGGTTWTKTTAAITGAQFNGNYSDLLMHPTDPNTLYCAVGDANGAAKNGVYKTTNGASTWAAAGNHPSGATNGVISIAISKSNPLVLYSIIENPGNSQLLEMMKTTDGGVTWNQIVGVPNFMGGQGWYDQCVAVDPLDENVVYVGGQTSILKSQNGGTSWTSIASGANGVGPHVDHHGFAFDANGKLLNVNDGGIWRLNDPTLATLNWSSLNGDLQITQFIGIATDPTNPNLLYGGSQDNGTEKYTGVLGWTAIRGGDGGYVRVEPGNGSVLYHSFFYSGSGFIERSDNGGVNWAGKTSGINFADSANFYPPYVIDPSNPSRLLVGTTKVYETVNKGDLWTAISAPSTNGWGGATVIDCIGIAPTDINTIYAAAGSAVYVTTNRGATWTLRTSGLTADHFKDIQVDPTDSLTAYIVRDRFGNGKVFKTTNGGVNWTNINGNLPDIPTDSIQIIPNNPGQADDVLFVGTDAGAYRSKDGGVTWATYKTGLPNAAVFDLDFNAVTNILSAGTHGRGAFQITLPTSPSITPLSNSSTACGPAYTGPTPVSGGTPPLTWTLLAGPGGMTIDSSTGVVSWPTPIASPTSYTITIKAENDGGGFDTKTFQLTVKPGDFNGDGLTDTSDLPDFVNHLLGLAADHICAADVNVDGNVDGLDAQAWINSSLTP